MPYILRLLRIIIFLLCQYAIFSQNDISKFEGYLLSNFESEDMDIDILLETLGDLLNDPIDYNNCTRIDLEEIGLLSFSQIENFLLYRKEMGDFLNIHELQAIPDFDLDLVQLLKDIGRIQTVTHHPLHFKKVFAEGRSSVFIRWNSILEKQKAYLSDSIQLNVYEGDKQNYSIKCTHRYKGRLKLGFTAEKDAGESIFKGSNKHGFDYNSAYLSINEPYKNIKKLLIGDFSINMGQGLIAFSGYQSGKNAEVMSVMNSSKLLSPHSSTSEFLFQRGLGMEFDFPWFNSGIFVSYNKIDATISKSQNDPNDTLSVFEINSIPQTGYHRSQSEIEKEKMAGLLTYGGQVGISLPFVELGLNFIHNLYEYEVNKVNYMYNQHFKPLKNYINASMDYKFSGKNSISTGELAMSDFKSFAFIHKTQFSLSKSFDMALVYRNYSRNYFSIYGKAFSEGSTVNNESGVYFAGYLRINPDWNLKVYFDIWQHKWLKYQVDAPSKGHEMFIKLSHTKKRKYNSYLQLKLERKALNHKNVESRILNSISNRLSYSLRAHYNYKLKPFIELRSRVEWHQISYNQEQKANGFMIFQDLLYKPLRSKMSFTARYVIFDSPEFETRIYAYENDLLYNFSIPAYDNNGSRFYLNMRYKFNRYFTGEFRIARSYFPFEDSISSGNEKIDGKSRTQLKAQVKISL